MTIIELLVSLALGSILLVSAVSVFQGNRQTYRVAENLAEVQENGRIALQIIARDLRMVSQMGCGSRRAPFGVSDDASERTRFDYYEFAEDGTDHPDFAPEVPVRVFDNTEDWDGPDAPTDGGDAITVCDADGAGGACQVSDAISIMRGSETVAALLSPMPNESGPIQIRTSDYTAFSGDDDLYTIANCLRGQAFRGAAAVAGSTTTITPTSPLAKTYPASSMIMPLTGSIYFVAVSPSGSPTLYRQPLQDNGVFPDALPIASGIEGMQVMLGIDADNDLDPDTYVNPAAVGDWRNVVSVRVALLARSNTDNVLDVATSINFLDGTAAAGVPGSVAVNSGEDADRRLRMTFIATITLRNTLP